MKTCSRCDAELKDDEKICHRCGCAQGKPSKQMYPGELTEDTEIID